VRGNLTSFWQEEKKNEKQMKRKGTDNCFIGFLFCFKNNTSQPLYFYPKKIVVTNSKIKPINQKT
jgi:hypothetical protein